MIGEVAEDNIGVMRRVYREGHEIGNHTWTHPDISEISNRQVDLRTEPDRAALRLRARSAAALLPPALFHRPGARHQRPGRSRRRASRASATSSSATRSTPTTGTSTRANLPQEITDSVFQQIADMETKPWNRGSIILLHDGGGDRSATIAALPVLIEALRAHGYEIVPVSELVGKTRAEVMPPLTPRQRWQARADSITFFFYSFFHYFVVGVFFVGDVLMSGRLIIIGIFAIIDRFRTEKELRDAGLSTAGRRADPRLQRRKGDRPDHPLRDDVELQEHPHHRHRRRLDGQDLRRGARGLPGRYRLRPPDRTDQTERRQGGRAELRARANRRRDLRRDRRRRRDRPRCDHQPRAALRQSEDRRGRRQRQGGQPREPLDPLAGARIHHQPELRAPRSGSLRRRHGRARGDRRVADGSR